MNITEACLFIADMTWGYPCSIKDNADGWATVISTEEAFREWEQKNEYSSPCVYWP